MNEDKLRVELESGIVIEGPPNKIYEMLADSPELTGKPVYYKGNRISSMPSSAIKSAILELVIGELLWMGTLELVGDFVEADIRNGDLLDSLVTELRSRLRKRPGLRFSAIWE